MRAVKLVIVALLLAGGLFRSAIAQTNWRSVYGINFGPYLCGKQPGDGVTEPELERLLGIIDQAGITQRLRTYGADDGLENIPALVHNSSLGFNFTDVAMGTYIAGADPNNPMDNPQLQTLVARANAGLVQTAIVGNEEIDGNRFDAPDMVKFINAIKAEVSVPVTTAEPFGVWFSQENGTTIKPEMESLVQAMDKVFVNIYPFHLNFHIDDAVTQLAALYDAALDAVHQLDPNKTVVIAETGWPSDGEPKGAAIPSLANQRQYYDGVAAWAEANSVELYWFDAFDENWKAPPGYEARWGLWNTNEISKRSSDPDIHFWDADSNGNWHDPNNWEPVGTPQSNWHVVLDKVDGTVVQLASNSTVETVDITGITPGTMTLNIQQGTSLTVTDILNVNCGGILSGAGSIVGNVQVNHGTVQPGESVGLPVPEPEAIVSVAIGAFLLIARFPGRDARGLK